MTILVTGGTKGIGRGIATRFAAEGANVIVNYASDDRAAETTIQELRKSGGHADAIKADLSSADGICQLAESVSKLTDHLDQVVHGAVWPLRATPLEVDLNAFAKATWVNGTSLLALTQATRHLLGRGSSIFMITSRGSEIAVPGYIAVGAPKALAEAIVRYLAVALAPRASGSTPSRSAPC